MKQSKRVSNESSAAHFRYDLDALTELLRTLRSEGRTVIMGVAYAGDSRSMTIENLKGVHDVFRKEAPEAWLHCDGCHGTSLLFSKVHADKLDGITLYDSITLDPHKVLAVPYPTSILLTRDQSALKAIRTRSDLIMRQALSLGQTTPALGSKSFFSLRLWMLFKTLGCEGIGKMIDRRLQQAAEFEHLIDVSPRFVQINQRNINSVIFLYVPENVTMPLSSVECEYVSQLNRQIYDRLLEDGSAYVHSFVIADNGTAICADPRQEFNVLRYMAGNPLIDEEDMELVLGILEGFAKDVLAEEHRIGSYA